MKQEREGKRKRNLIKTEKYNELEREGHKGRKTNRVRDREEM